MKLPIPHHNTLLDLLQTVAQKSGHKTSLAAGKFKRDYGNVLYITQNRTRANQLNVQLMQEVAQSREKAIIPPAILPYTAGFVRLAAFVKFGYADSLNICRYSDEWFNLFLYEVAKNIIPNDFFSDEFGMANNKRANLAKDFRTFICDVVFHLKTSQTETLYHQLNDLTDTERLFVQAYEAYRAEEKNFNTDNQFMHPLQAYEFLHAHVCKNNPNGLNKVIIIENEDLLEPLFREIVDKLPCPVYVLQDTPVDAESYKHTTDLYHFMTPLDEAEFVGWKIKSLLTRGIPSTDIGIVCANQASKEVLKTVFKRMDIAGEQLLPLAANGYYRLVKMLFSLIYNTPDASFCAETLFTDHKSKFKLGKGRYIFQKLLAKKGLKFQLCPAESLSECIHEFINTYQNDSAYENDIKALGKLKELLSAKPSASKIAESVINDKKDKALVNDIMTALYELDENLKTEEPASDDFIKKAHALFSILDRRELNTPRQPLALEEASVAANNQDENSLEPELNYSFSVVPAEQAKTLRVKHLFLCGFSAGADRIGLASYPNLLAKRLSLPTLDDKKIRSVQSVQYALNYAAETNLTYAYLKLDGKEDGQSALVQLLEQVLPPEKRHIGKDNQLLKSYDLLLKEQGQSTDMPDPSWTGAQKAKREENHLLEFTEKVLFAKTQTRQQLLEEIIQPDAQGRRAIAAKLFADFIICPSRFFFTLLAKSSGMKITDAAAEQRISKGLFWHRVFEKAAALPEFYGQGEQSIKAALEKTLEETLKVEDISKFDTNDNISFLAQAQEEILSLFAHNEAERQKKYNLQKYEDGLEKKFSYPIPGCAFDIHGQVDRMDACGDDTIFFWDYKTGNPKAEPIEFYKKTGLVKKENSLQLAIYMYWKAKTRPQNQTEPPKLCAGNIFINGKDNIGNQTYNKTLEQLLDDQMQTFAASLQEPLWDFPGDTKVNDSFGGKCTYCNFKSLCKVISNYAGGSK